MLETSYMDILNLLQNNKYMKHNTQKLNLT
jgi:hypothetical protein